MSLLLIGAVVGASIALVALVLIVVTVGIHRQEHAASLTHRPRSLSAALARRVLGLHTPGPNDRADQPKKEDAPCP